MTEPNALGPGCADPLNRRGGARVRQVPDQADGHARRGGDYDGNAM